MDELKQKNGFGFRTIVISFAIIAVVMTVSAFLIAYGYFWKNESGLARFLHDKLNRPVAFVNYINPVYSSRLNSNVLALRRFYENQDFSKVGMRVDFSTEDGQMRLKIKEKEILNKLIEDRAIMLLAEKRGVEISRSDIDNGIKDALVEFGNGNSEIEKDLEKLYGWSMDDFKKNIVKPSMYKEALEKHVEKELNSDGKALEMIRSAQVELNKGKEFASVEKMYSEGVASRGSLGIGWIRKDQLIPEVADRIFSEKESESNEIIESKLGYHIVKVDEVKKEDGIDMVRIRQIFSRKKTFADWLGNEMKKMEIWILAKDYSWNAEFGEVEFSDEYMRIEEEELRKKSNGDASMMF